MSRFFSILLLFLLMATALFPMCRTSTAESLIPSPLKVTGFNIRRFGLSKISKPGVSRNIVEIISRYHLVLAMEIVDKSGKAIHQLVDELSEATGQSFGLLLSPRVGRRVYEQYAFIYRKDMLSVVRSGVYPDAKDVFEREPFIAEFNSGKRVRYLKTFTIIASHTKPDDAAVEIDALSDVLDFVRDGRLAELAREQRRPTNNVMVLGDLNADCSYFTAAESKENRLSQRSDVAWFPNDRHDTTVSSTDCAYDRLIVYQGDEASTSTAPLMRALIPQSVKAFRFDENLGLSEDEASAVSDHYPLEFMLKPPMLPTAMVSDGLKFHWDASVSTSVTETAKYTATSTSSCNNSTSRSVSDCDWKPYQIPTSRVHQLVEDARFSLITLYDSAHQPVQLVINYNSYRLSATAILGDLRKLRRRLPQLISSQALDVLEYKLPTLDDHTVFDPMSRARHTAQVVCEVTCGNDESPRRECVSDRSVCTVIVRKQTRIV